MLNIIRILRRKLDLRQLFMELGSMRNSFLTNNRIASGPFADISYINKNLSGRTQSALLGTYEKELWPTILKLNNMDFDVIINAGAGEGYYAVGFAVRHPTTSVIAYEANEKAQVLLRRNAEMNNVENIEVKGCCDVGTLKKELESKKTPMIMMDVEGAELELLDIVKIPELKSAHIVVELHDFVLPSISDELYARFQNSHEIELILARARTLDDFPLELHFPFNFIPKRFDLEAIREIRDGTVASWYYMAPKPLR